MIRKQLIGEEVFGNNNLVRIMVIDYISHS
jgi:hypothetical protein